MTFTWDEEKGKSNKSRHHLSFSLASKAFYDPNRVVLYDEGNSVEEDRFITIGFIQDVPIFVSYTMRDDTIRTISARKALRAEVEKYYLPHKKI